jgi:CrcB protein
MPLMKLLMQYLSVAGAGAVGAVFRFFIASLSGAIFRTTFPVGTFIINISGSLFLGWFLAFARNRIVVPDTLRLAIAVGFVGAYTTFSTFMYESNALLESGSGIKAMGNLIGSVVVGLIAVRFGIWLGER